MDTSRAAISGRTARRASVIAVASLVASGLGGVPLAAPAAAAGGTVLTSESFSGATVTDPNWKTGGSGGFTACLTASTNTTQAGIPGCPQGSPGLPSGGDAPGSGVLRLTSLGTFTTGYLLYDVPLPFTQGLVATLDQYQYAGSGADGLGFFLADGSAPAFSVGGSGGSLGYAQRTGVRGVPQGYLGLGLDAFGNYALDTEGRGGTCTVAEGQSPFGSTRKPNTITLRGPGDATSKYCWLGTSGTPAGTALSPVLRTAGPTRTAANTKQGMRVTVNPSTSLVTIERNMYDGNGYRLLLSAPLPANPPATIKFGLLGSTGGSTDIHEISNKEVSTLTSVAKLRTSIAQSSGAGVSGGTGTLTVGVSSDPAEGAGASPIIVTSAMPTGVTMTGTPSGDGWTCTASTTSRMSCTRSPGLYPAGTTFPDITIPVAYATTFSTNTVLVSATATATDAGPGEAHTVLVVAPVAVNDLATTHVGVPVTIDVHANDKGSLDLGSIVVPSTGNPGAPAHGTATPTASGQIVYAPTAGWSGVDTFTYTISDTDGQTASATVTVATQPEADPVVTSTDLPDAVDVDVLAAARGDLDPTRVAVTQPVGGATTGTVTVDTDTGLTTFTPATNFTGDATYTYTVYDYAGQSATSTVTVIVNPGFRPSSFTTPVAVNHTQNLKDYVLGDVNWATLAIHAEPANGDATVVPCDPGCILYTTPDNWSGPGLIVYQTVDPVDPDNQSLWSIGTISFVVTPTAADEADTVDAAVATSLDVLANDKGDLDPSTVSVTSGPAHGTASVLASGEIEYTSNALFSGTDTFVYRVFDFYGSAASATVTITVRPTTRPAVGSVPVHGVTAMYPLAGSAGNLYPATLALATAPPNGEWTWDPTTLTGVYSATGEWSGVFATTYTVCDRQSPAFCPTSAFNVTVVPTTQADAASTAYQTAVVLDVLANDHGSLIPSTVAIGTAPAHGTTSIDATMGAITYTPAAGWSGADPFTYTVSDGVTTVTGTVVVTTGAAPGPGPGPGPGPDPTPVPPPTPGPTPGPGPTPTPDPDPDPQPPGRTPQRPTRPLALATSVVMGGTTVVVPEAIRTNAGQRARVWVFCTLVRPGRGTSAAEVRPTGDVPLCEVRRNAKGRVWVTVHSTRPVKVRVVITAPGTAQYRPYRHVKTYITHAP